MNECVDFCGLAAYYFASEEIAVELRYPSSWFPLDVELYLCAENPEVQTKALQTVNSGAVSEGKDWTQGTLVIPPTELESQPSGRYRFRCSRRGKAVGLSQQFTLCFEPRDIPILSMDEHILVGYVGASVESCRRSPSSLDSFILLEEDEAEREGGARDNDDSLRGAPSVPSHLSDELCSGTSPGKPLDSGPLQELTSVDLQPPSKSDAGTCTTLRTVTDNWTQTVKAEEDVQTGTSCETVKAGEDVQTGTSCEASSVSEVSATDVSLLKSNNRDLLVKVRKLASRVQTLEKDLRDERAASDAAQEGLRKAEEALQLSLSNVVSVGAEKDALAQEKDDLFAEVQQLTMNAMLLSDTNTQLQNEMAVIRLLKDEAESNARTLEKDLGARQEIFECINAHCSGLEAKLTSLEADLQAKDGELRAMGAQLMSKEFELTSQAGELRLRDSLLRQSGERVNALEKALKTAEAKILKLKKERIPSSGTITVQQTTGGTSSGNPQRHLKQQVPKNKCVTGTQFPRNLVRSSVLDRPPDKLVDHLDTGRPAVVKSSSSCSAGAETTIKAMQLVQAHHPDLSDPFVCPICECTLPSRDNELTKTIHIEKCLAKQSTESDHQQ